MTSPVNRAAALVSIGGLAVCAGGAAAQAQQYTATLFASPESFQTYLNGAGGGFQGGSFLGGGDEPWTHAVLWNGLGSPGVDLNPAGADSSSVNACAGMQQAGVASSPEGETWAVVWNGTAASAVVLNPPGFGFATAYGTDGSTQVGIGRGPGTGRGPHALAWTGTAASFADLHPDEYTFSWAYAVDGPRIAGAATDSFDMLNAGYWTGRSADTWVPLHPQEGFEETVAVAVSGTAFVGNGRGTATNGETHALLWLDDGGTLVDLHPTTGTPASYATAVRGGVQAGSMAYSTNEHAVVWHGTPESMVDLHNVVEGFWTDSRVTAIDSDGVLYGYVSAGTNAAAVRWTPQPVVCGPADLGSAGGVNGSDGRLDNNDFIAFIGRFFSHDAAADLGVAGGQPGSDGEFNNNDFIAFINLFFSGC